MSNKHIRKEPDIADTQRSLTDFEHVLLGYIARRPESGYGLKKRFGRTPLGVYRPSPGALYPALRRLVGRGLLIMDEPADKSRAHRIYRATDEGRAIYLAWLRAPIDPETVGGDLALHIMRFAMMGEELPAADSRAFLTALADALDRSIDGVENYIAAGEAPATRNVTLALEHGIATQRASRDWARAALRDLDAG